MSNFRAIGLPVASPEELERAIQNAITRAAPPAGLGKYAKNHLYFRDPSGAAFGAHFDRGQDISCITPFFDPPEGGTLWSIRTSSAVRDRECVHCSGADCDVLERDSGTLATRTSVQWLFFQPFARWLEQERTYDVQLTGFASALTLCAGEEDFGRAQSSMFGEPKPDDEREPLRVARTSFFPIGMFGSTDSVTHRATAALCGEIDSVVERTNELTGVSFAHVRVKTLAGLLDVVAPVEALENAPATPALAVAQVWLVGRPANVTPPPQPSFWQKLTGG